MIITKKIIITSLAVLVFLIGGGVVYATNSPTARAERQLNLGNKYLQEGKYQEAILAFEKVIQIESKNIPARLGLGKVYVATNEFEKAEIVLQEIFEIEPNHIESHEDLFKVYLMQGKLDEADATLQEIIKIDTSRNVKELILDLESAKILNASKASYDQGIKQMNDKQYLEAVDSFQKVIKEDTERYSDAQLKSNECKITFIDTTLKKVKDAIAYEDYLSALNLLDQILKVDSNNQDALKLKSDYEKAFAEKKAADEKAKAIHSNESLVEEVTYFKLLSYKIENGVITINGLILINTGKSNSINDQLIFKRGKNAELKFKVGTKIKCVEISGGPQYRTLEDYLEKGGYSYSPKYSYGEEWKNDNYPTLIITKHNGTDTEIGEAYRV